jgi:hypothetical protein
VAESSLSIQLSDLASEVGQLLGFGRTASGWTGWQGAAPYVPAAATTGGVTLGSSDTQLGLVMAVVQAGVRQFYNPEAVAPEEPPHRWSFLTPERTITTVTSQSDYPLPDDHGGFEGEMTFDPTNTTWTTIRRVGVGMVRREQQLSQGLTGRPTLFAEFPKPSDGVTGQRFGVAFYPTPDAAYVLTYRCNVLPVALSATNPFPYGGEQHGETILESVLDVAERRLNDEVGVHRQAYLSRLRASVAADARDHRPENLGYNGDGSDGAGRGGPNGLHPWTNLVTYGGNSMG